MILEKSKVLVNNMYLSNLTKDTYVKSCLNKDRSNYLSKKNLSDSIESELIQRKENSLYLKHLSYLSKMITEHVEDRKPKITIIYEYVKDNLTIIEVASDDSDSLDLLRSEIKLEVPEFKELINFRISPYHHIYINDVARQRIRFFGKKHKLASI